MARIKKSVLVIHRQYRHKGGEDTFLERALVPALRSMASVETVILPPLGSRVLDFIEIIFMVLGFERLRPSYFFAGRNSQKHDVVIFNNFIPTVSMALPRYFKTRGARVIFWTHNARLGCANGLNFDGQKWCQDCSNIGAWKSFIKNCQRNYLQSLIYSLVYRRGRVAKMLRPWVDLICPVSEFTGAQVNNLMKELHLDSIPTHVVRTYEEKKGQRSESGEYFLFLGRLSEEKGIREFLDLAQKFPGKNFVIAGDGPLLNEVTKFSSQNLKYVGVVDSEGAKKLVKACVAVVICSRVPENGPMVVFEAKEFEKPVIYPRGGGAEEMVRWLGLPGCPLDQFEGQSQFESPVIDSSRGYSFQREIKDILD